MFKSMVVTDDLTIKEECRQVLQNFDDIDVEYYDTLENFRVEKPTLTYLFALVSDFNHIRQPQFKLLKEFVPDLQLIIYNRNLALNGIGNIESTSGLRLVIGEDRRQNLQRHIDEIKKTHWRNIPLETLGIDKNTLSPRMKQAIRFMETAEISNLQSRYIARHLGISPGYFSQAFHKETGRSFRSFRQSVMDYYEAIILSRFNLSAHHISRLLGYSELSSFSRSFKRRQGLSPTQYKKTLKA